MKIKISLLCVVFWTCICTGNSEEVRVHFYPEATHITSSISPTTPDIAKLSWNAALNSGYIIQAKPSLSSGVWNTFSTETGTSALARRSVVMGTQEYFTVSSTPSFAVGETVEWRADLPDISPVVRNESTAVWKFSDGTTASITGDSWQTPISKTYDYMGVKTATVVISHPSGWKVTNEWAVSITNSLANLVVNGDFELENGLLPLGWNKGGFGSNSRSFIYPVQGFRGSEKAAQVVISNYVSGDAKWYFDEVPVQPGGKYHLTVWYTSTAPLNLTVRFTHTDNSYSYDGVTIRPPSATWDQLERDIYPQEGVKAVTVFPSLVGNGSLTIDSVSLVRIPVLKPLSEGMISIDIDDGWKETADNVSAILEAANYRGTFYIVTPRIGKSGILTQSDLHSLQNSGHEIGAHSLSHDDLTAVNLATMETEINLSRNDLRSWGLRPVSAFAYPFGAYNATVKQLAQEAGFRSASSTDGGNNQKGTDLYALKRTSLRSSMTVNDIKAKIDVALAQKQWFIMVLHHVDSTVTEYSVSPEFFQEIVTYLKSKNAKVVTASEGVRLLTH